jgi:hypothetical protein
VVSSCASDSTHLFARYSTLEHYRLRNRLYIVLKVGADRLATQR